MTYGTGLTRWPVSTETESFTAVHVFIGRNLSEEISNGQAVPMSQLYWEHFIAETLDAVKTLLSRIDTCFTVEGTGVWHGVPEGSAVVTAIGQFTPGEVLQLKREVGELAHRYSQASIAVTAGYSELVASRPPAGRTTLEV